MNEETKGLKEILFALLYAKYFQHGTDIHDRLMVLASHAQEVGYDCDLGSSASGFTLYKDNYVVLEVPRID